MSLIFLLDRGERLHSEWKKIHDPRAPYLHGGLGEAPRPKEIRYDYLLLNCYFPVHSYLVQESGSVELTKAYNSCVRELIDFRKDHLNIVEKYVAFLPRKIYF